MCCHWRILNSVVGTPLYIRPHHVTPSLIIFLSLPAYDVITFCLIIVCFLSRGVDSHLCHVCVWICLRWVGPLSSMIPALCPECPGIDSRFPLCCMGSEVQKMDGQLNEVISSLIKSREVWGFYIPLINCMKLKTGLGRHPASLLYTILYIFWLLLVLLHLIS